MAGCIAHAPGSGGSGQQIDVTIASTPPSPVLLPVSIADKTSTVQFTATVSGTSNHDVSWTLAADLDSTCSTDSLGTISASGFYTAPSAVNVSPCDVVVNAQSMADHSAQAQARVRVQVVVAISPQGDSIGQVANRQFIATVFGTSNQLVNWQATGDPNVGGGAFDPKNDGLYISPPLPEGTDQASATITATSQFDVSAVPATATMTIKKNDPLGTISNLQTLASNQCPADSNGGLADATCYSMTVSCDAIADITTYVKVNTASSPVGTVLFLIGSGGNGLYDSYPSWQFGWKTVESVFNAHFNTVQISFGEPFTTAQPNGWLQGPGGVRRLACRYATIVDWAYNNPKTIDSNSTAKTTAPLCATGNSAGAAAIAYAALDYGLGSTNVPAEFTMIEPTAGPVMTRLDQGCVCDQNNLGDSVPKCQTLGHPPMCYTPSEAAIVDTAYQEAGQTQPTLCTNGLTGTDTTDAKRFQTDSIFSQPSKLMLTPRNTAINARFGALDMTTGVPQGQAWMNGFGTVLPQACTDDATHAIPDVIDGATDIANDIISGCVLPPLSRRGTVRPRN